MALVTEAFDADGIQKTFQVGNDILSSSHCRVHFYYDEIDNPIADDDWDLLGKSTIVFVDAPTADYVVKITTSSDGQGLDTAPSDMSIIAANIGELVNLSDNMPAILSVNDDLANIDTVLTQMTNIDINAVNIGSIVTVAEAISTGSGIGGTTGGQYLGNGIIKGIEYFAQEGASTDSMVVVAGTNAMSVESFTIANGGSLEIQDGSTYKIL